MFSLIFLFFNGSISAEQPLQTNKQNKDYFEVWESISEPRQTLKNASNFNLNDKKAITDYITLLWGKNAKTMIKIVECESNFNPHAINWNDAKITGMPSQGIAQINAPYDERLFDWKYNLDVAFEIYQRRSFQPWSCFSKKLI